MGYLTTANIGGADYKLAGALYGTCGTAAGTAAKVVTCADFDSLETGVTILVKFTYGNTASNATMNVNGSGAKPLCQYGTTRVGTDGYGSWVAGAIIPFTYDGTSWVRSTVLTTANDLVTQNSSLDSDSIYSLLLKCSPGISNETGVVRFSPTGLNYNVRESSLYCYKFNNYVLSDACAKAVDTSIASDSTSTNLPTSAAVAALVASAVTGASEYKGAITAESSLLNTALTKGWYYVVAMPDAQTSSITIGGKTCEAGDMVWIRDSGTYANSTALADHIDIIQSNIDTLTNPEITTLWNNAVPVS